MSLRQKGLALRNMTFPPPHFFSRKSAPPPPKQKKPGGNGILDVLRQDMTRADELRRLRSDVRGSQEVMVGGGSFGFFLGKGAL